MLNKKVNFKMFACVAMCAVMMAGIGSCKQPPEEPPKDPREDFVGSFRTNMEWVEGSSVKVTTYTLTITKSATNANDIIMANINGWGESVRATVNGNAFTIPQQTILQYGISGSGTLNGNVLTFSTMETYSGGLTNTSQVATKQ